MNMSDVPERIRDKLRKAIIEEKGRFVELDRLSLADWSLIRCSKYACYTMKNFCRQQMKLLAKTFFDWLIVYHASFPGSPLEKEALEIMGRLASAYDEKKIYKNCLALQSGNVDAFFEEYDKFAMAADTCCSG
jgi:hypothetical protein